MTRDVTHTMAMLGFAGIETAVRAGGRVLPRKCREDDLPRLRDALAKIRPGNDDHRHRHQ